MPSRDNGKGILLPLFSLPTSDFDSSFRFADILINGGVTLWQLLPVCPTGKGGSPYFSPCCFAGDVRYIGTELLRRGGYIKEKNLPKYRALQLAAAGISDSSPDFLAFCEQNGYWLYDYALYTVLRGRLPKSKTERKNKAALYKAECAGVCKTQFLFFSQLKSLRDYLNLHGVKLVGDMPIYISDEGVETLCRPSLFDLDERGRPAAVAGVPPDKFSRTGQLWGNPLYAWDKNPEGCYDFFRERFREAKELYDIIRIDHFRGFADYYAVPPNDTTALNGVFRNGPGAGLFKRLESELGTLHVIAEDMGTETAALNKLVRETGYPGMRVFQFDYKKEIPENCAVYTGTHDNDTLLGWYSALTAGERREVNALTGASGEKDIFEKTFSYLLLSPARYVIIPAADFLGKGRDARINTPGTSAGNWLWKMSENDMRSFEKAVMKYAGVL